MDFWFSDLLLSNWFNSCCVMSSGIDTQEGTYACTIRQILIFHYCIKSLDVNSYSSINDSALLLIGWIWSLITSSAATGRNKKLYSKRDPFQAHSCYIGTSIANKRATKSITQLAIYIQIMLFWPSVSYRILNLPYHFWKYPLHHKCIYLHTPKNPKQTKPPFTHVYRLNRGIYIWIPTCSTTLFLQSYIVSKVAILE